MVIGRLVATGFVFSVVLSPTLEAHAFQGSPADRCWDAAADMTGVQGENDWLFGYRESGGAFQLMTEYGVESPTTWTVDWLARSPMYWTQISPNIVCPNGTTTCCGRTPVDHEVVLRWVSPLTGRVRIQGTAKLVHPDACGNGIDWFIRHNASSVHSAYIPGSGSTVYSHVSDVLVTTGDVIDFAFNAHLSIDACDTYEYTAKIRKLGTADINVDCVVNVTDLLAVIGAWGPCPPSPAACPADIAPTSGGDGQVNVTDLLLVIGEWD